jgi:hypothetical protein
MLIAVSYGQYHIAGDVAWLGAAKDRLDTKKHLGPDRSGIRGVIERDMIKRQQIHRFRT